MVRDGYKLTELGEIPQEWRLSLAKDVIELRHGYQFREYDFVSSGIPVIKITELGKNGKLDFKNVTYISYTRLHEFEDVLMSIGDVLLTLTGGTLGKTAVVDKDYGHLVQNYRVGNLLPKNKNIITKFIYYLTISDIIQKQIFSKINEAAQPNLGKADFDFFKIPLPPLPEQEKIASILSSVDENIEKTEALIEKFKDVRKGLMSDCFTKGVDEEGNIRNEESHEFKDSVLGRVPVEWDIVEISKVISKVIDFRGKTPKKIGMDWGGGNIPALSANNVEMGKINFEKESYYGSEDLYKNWMTKGDTEKGDVIMTMEAPLGNIATIPDDKKYILSQRVLLFKTKKQLILNPFFKHQSMGPFFQSQLIENATGTTAKGIQQSKLLKLYICKPSLTEQKRIAEILIAADQSIEKEEAYRDKLLEIKKGLMQDLLTGRVSVTA